MRYKIVFSYAGALFNGYQRQPNKRTVQQEIEKVLSMIDNKHVDIVAAGRTDSGVNALGQVAHFDLERKLSTYKLKGALNSYLPKDIHIISCEVVTNDFHARYNVKSKTYEYVINTNEYNPILCSQVFQYCKPLNIKEMKKACKYFIGTHDFTTFACSSDKRDNKIRTIYDVRLEETDGLIKIIFHGTGFLRYQIRNMVGVLIRVGENKLDYKSIPKLLELKDRRKIGMTARPEGLTLVSINY